MRDGGWGGQFRITLHDYPSRLESRYKESCKIVASQLRTGGREGCVERGELTDESDELKRDFWL
jgi:hypothetical protein